MDTTKFGHCELINSFSSCTIFAILLLLICSCTVHSLFNSLSFSACAKVFIPRAFCLITWKNKSLNCNVFHELIVLMEYS
ncbi:hypothetical protein HZS_7874 [Henneguya salminicola]|nr:hypothetical protein HZS_7874 [Henneguya salminicola]